MGNVEKANTHAPLEGQFYVQPQVSPITFLLECEDIYKILDRCGSSSSSVRKEEMTPQSHFKI